MSEQPSYADRFFFPDGSFRSPELAAEHATLIQGGFSTPRIEAERMIRDGGLGRQVALDWLKVHRRYRVVFTPVGWQVIDSTETREPLAYFGLGAEEYRRAAVEAAALNASAS